jgi:riboflavin kinase/FMN adenylyltransferase
VTFDRNPLSLLRPDLCPPTLTSNQQKLELLESTGVDAVLMLTFDEQLAAQSPAQFVGSVLADALHARVVLVGADFRFGARGAGDVDVLRELGQRHGFEVVLVPDVMSGADGRLSSTRIRTLLAAGHVAEAAVLLGRAPSVRSIVVRGAQRGHELGFPTANLDPARLEGLIPADGVYAGWLTVRGTRYPAAISVGNNPTFTGVAERQVEAYALDESFDLYGATAEVAFVEYVRGMLAFDDVDALVVQMREDVERIRAILADRGRA